MDRDALYQRRPFQGIYAHLSETPREPENPGTGTQEADLFGLWLGSVGFWIAEKEALLELNAELFERPDLVLRLDALGDHD